MPASAAPGVLLSVWAKWGLTESFHVSASDPTRCALTRCHKHTQQQPFGVIYHWSTHAESYYTRLGDDGDDRRLRETASKKRKEIVPSLFPHLTGSQLVISMAQGEAETVRKGICQSLASMMMDCCATGALITIKRALSHTLFLLLCLFCSPAGITCTRTHTHADVHRGEALISGRKEYNE